MNDAMPPPAAPNTSSELELVRKAFPELRCLRCNHDDFYLLPTSGTLDQLGAIAIACRNCGFVEQHLLGLLRSSAKPVVPKGSND